MNLISCEGCGIILDKDILSFPEYIEDGDGVIREKLAGWNGRRWVAKTHCPVCGSDILEKE